MSTKPIFTIFLLLLTAVFPPITSGQSDNEGQEEWYWIDGEGTKRTRAELDTVLVKHKRWYDFKYNSFTPVSPADTARANLSGAKLSGANLFGADLLGADLTEAVLWEVDLRSADLRSAELTEANLTWANLTGAKLSGADLSGVVSIFMYLTEADLRQADLSGANLRGAYLGGTLFEPDSLPTPEGIAYAENLDRLRYQDNPTPLVQLKQSLWDAGFKKPSKAVNTALRRVEASWLETALFDWTCEWGINPWRPFLVLAILWFVLGVFYIFTRMRTTKDGKYLLASKRGLNRETQLRPDIWEFRVKFFKRIHIAFLFSLERSLRIGFREFSPNHWLKLLMPPDFELRSYGWPRFVSGMQSLISVCLIALSILSYFSRPFEF